MIKTLSTSSKLMLVTLLAATTSILLPLANSQTVKALDGWDAGSIIDDVVFTNKYSMTVDQIQQFLNAKVSNCDTNGTQSAADWGRSDLTHAQYAALQIANAQAAGKATNWHLPPYTCLKDYSENGKKTAQIIYDAAQQYTISPKVLIVLLQKEQGLVTDTWPLAIQYRSATGYGCPDTAPCDSEYYGLTNQITWAARMFRSILNDSPTWNKKYYPYWTADPATGVTGPRYVAYSPIKSCGGSWINISNRSTQALYNYTPYQPNPAALEASMGSGVDCGAYGNVNFYRYFTGWFGTVRGYKSLDTPRWMVLKADTYKKDPASGEDIDGVLNKGTQLKFITKVLVNNVWYLRTAYDSANNIEKGIPIEDLDEISYESLTTPQTVELKSDTHKLNPRSESIDNSLTLYVGSQIKVSSKILINNQWYFRSSYDDQNNNDKAILADKLSDIPYQNLETPRYFAIKNDTYRVNPITGEKDTALIAKGTQYKFTTKIQINGTWYFRTEDDTTNNLTLAISIDDITDVPYETYGSSSAWLQLTTDLTKINPTTGSPIDWTLSKGMQLNISSKSTVNGTLYYRTAFDTNHNLNKAILATNFENIPFVAMESPRILTVAKDTQKRDPATGEKIDGVINTGTQLNFDTKVLINNQWYLRTEYDTLNNFYKGILLTDLQ